MFDKPKHVIDSGLECIRACPAHKEVGFIMSTDVIDMLEYLQQTFKDVEFLVYGNATLSGKIYKLDDIVIPEQKVGYSHVNQVKATGIYNTVIHKHPGDANFFSLADENFINSNHTFSLLIGSKDLEDIIGQHKIKTDCGRYLICRLNIYKEKRSPTVDENFIEQIKNIKREGTIIDIFNKISNNIEKRNKKYGKNNVCGKKI